LDILEIRNISPFKALTVVEHKSRIELGWNLFIDIGFPWKEIGHFLEMEILREGWQIQE
jgi:hypothetical protein